MSQEWVLLDNQLTIHTFCNCNFLHDIRTAKRMLVLKTNAGSAAVSKVGDLPGVGKVWHHCNGIANMLSSCCKQKMNGFEIDHSS